jgi:hypothetical protein
MDFFVTAFLFFTLAEDFSPQKGHPIDPTADQPDFAPAICAIMCVALFGMPIFLQMWIVIEWLAHSLGLADRQRFPQDNG